MIEHGVPDREFREPDKGHGMGHGRDKGTGMGREWDMGPDTTGHRMGHGTG